MRKCKRIVYKTVITNSIENTEVLNEISSYYGVSDGSPEHAACNSRCLTCTENVTKYSFLMTLEKLELKQTFNILLYSI